MFYVLLVYAEVSEWTFYIHLSNTVHRSKITFAHSFHYVGKIVTDNIKNLYTYKCDKVQWFLPDN